MQRRIILVSYYAGVEGFSPSEWIKDKLRAAQTLGDKVLVITSGGSAKSKDGFKYVRVPSISWRDYLEELEFRRKYADKPGALILLWGVIPATLGRLADLLLEKVAGSWSQGKWSWTLLTSPLLALLRITWRPTVLVATGGPTGAQLSASLAAFVGRVPTILEFQDPFIWAGMAVGDRASRLMVTFERFMVGRATKVVFVTREASNQCRNRHNDFRERVVSLYPFAQTFKEVDGISPRKPSKSHTVRGLHLGTLYGSRNLDNLFSAISGDSDSRADGNAGLTDRIHITNMGGLHVQNKSDYLSRLDFELLDLVPRKQALEKARSFHFLILVQHSDGRSEQTIPFKTYDYLNLEMPVLAILNSSELSELLRKYGHFVAQADSPESIKSALTNLLGSLDSWRPLEFSNSDYVTQWERLTSRGIAVGED